MCLCNTIMLTIVLTTACYLPKPWRKFINYKKNGPEILPVWGLKRWNTISIKGEGPIEWIIFAEEATRMH